MLQSYIFWGILCVSGELLIRRRECQQSTSPTENVSVETKGLWGIFLRVFLMEERWCDLKLFLRSSAPPDPPGYLGHSAHNPGSSPMLLYSNYLFLIAFQHSTLQDVQVNRSLMSGQQVGTQDLEQTCLIFTIYLPSGACVTRFNAWCYQLTIRDAVLVRSPVGNNFQSVYGIGTNPASEEFG